MAISNKSQIYTPFIGNKWVRKTIRGDFESCRGYTVLKQQHQWLMGLLVNTSPNRDKRSQRKDTGFCRATEIIWREDYDRRVIVRTTFTDNESRSAYIRLRIAMWKASSPCPCMAPVEELWKAGVQPFGLKTESKLLYIIDGNDLGLRVLVKTCSRLPSCDVTCHSHIWLYRWKKEGLALAMACRLTCSHTPSISM